MKTTQKLLDMVDELKYTELFEELDKMGLNSEAYNRLKKEFVLGQKDIDFNDRLKVLINNFFLRKEIIYPSLWFLPSVIGFIGFYLGDDWARFFKLKDDYDPYILASFGTMMFVPWVYLGLNYLFNYFNNNFQKIS